MKASYYICLIIHCIDIFVQNFAENFTKSDKICHMFPLNPSTVETRHQEKYYVQPASTGRLKDSAIPYMQRLLNLQ